MISVLERSLRARDPRPEVDPIIPARPWVTWIAIGLLVAFAAMSLTAARTKGLSFDEGLQLAVGYNYWLNDDYRLEGANGDLIKRWATLPFLVTRPALAGKDAGLWDGGAYELGQRFFFELGNRPESLLLQGRAMTLLLGLATGVLVFVCSRTLFGSIGGLTSLAVFAFSPSMLAFAGIVSTDMSITLALFGSTWCVWLLLHGLSWRRLLASLLMAGMLALAKASALVILPIAIGLVVVKLAVGRPLLLRWGHRCRLITRRGAQTGVFALLLAIHVAAAWGAIWAHYGFRYAAHPSNPSLRTPPPKEWDHVPPVLRSLLRWMEETRSFPEGYRNGIHLLLGNDDRLGSFMNESWNPEGRALFFPYAMLVKTPPALFLLLAMSAILWWSVRRRKKIGPADASDSAPAGAGFYDASPFFVLIGCYVAAAMTEDLNIGHRHILPIYPALYVLAGGAALAFRPSRIWRWPRRGVAASVLWLVTDSIAIRPDYLAYFGTQAGGPANGYRRLVDSSLDWGMNLPALRQWIDHHNPDGREAMFLGYFGTDSPNYYGIKARRLPGFFDPRPVQHYPLTPGYYALSASLLQGVHTAAFGPWTAYYETAYRQAKKSMFAYRHAQRNPAARAIPAPPLPGLDWAREIDHFDNLRFARLCAWLRRQGPPQHQVGHGIFIWKLDQAALDAALLGPPAELVEGPAFAVRRFRNLGAAPP